MQTRETSGMPQDRRQAPRTKLAEIAYIGMGPENGGLVLDVSDGGLSFHSVAPVRQSETINFLLSSRGHNRIEGAGEVVWTNEMKTVCGLRFTSLSADARDYLNNWTNESRLAVAVRKKTVSPTPIAIVQPEEPPPVVEPQMDAEAESILAIRRAAENYLSEPAAKSIWREPIFFWVMFGMLSTVLAVTAFVYGVRVGKSETRSMAEPAAQPAALSDSQPTPQAPESAVPPTTAPTNSTSTSAVAPAVSSQPGSGQTDLSIVPSEKASNLRGAFVNASKTDGITPNSFDQPATPVSTQKPRSNKRKWH